LRSDEGGAASATSTRGASTASPAEEDRDDQRTELRLRQGAPAAGRRGEGRARREGDAGESEHARGGRRLHRLDRLRRLQPEAVGATGGDGPQPHGGEGDQRESDHDARVREGEPGREQRDRRGSRRESAGGGHRAGGTPRRPGGGGPPRGPLAGRGPAAGARAGGACRTKAVSDFSDCFLLVFGQLAVGGLFGLAVPPFALLERGFYKSTAAVFVGCATLFVAGKVTLLLRAGEASAARLAELGVWAVFTLTATVYLASLWGDARRRRARAYVIALALGLAALTVSASLRRLGPVLSPATVLYPLSFLTSALVLGAVATGLSLGHWYLI